MKKPIICVDFDGVLHSYTSGWKGMGRIDDPPVDGAVAWLAGLIEDGLRVAIYSSRSKSLRGRRAMKRWLLSAIRDRYGPDLTSADDLFSEIEWPWFKPPALITVDDRAWRFDGSFPRPRQLRAFRPWNKRGEVAPTGAAP